MFFANILGFACKETVLGTGAAVCIPKAATGHQIYKMCTVTVPHEDNLYKYCSMRPVTKYSPVQYDATPNIVAGPWA